jgi:hypothetical protein
MILTRTDAVSASLCYLPAVRQDLQKHVGTMTSEAGRSAHHCPPKGAISLSQLISSPSRRALRRISSRQGSWG